MVTIPPIGNAVIQHGTLAAGRLGIGTSAMMSRLNRRDSLQILRVAAELGITHFDTARAYGYGEAELVLGDLLAGQREHFTVTTKVGILPPKRALWLRAAKALARYAASLHPSLRTRLRQRAAALVQAGQFSPSAVEQSLHTSLQQLRTGYVDYLLLHECTAADLHNEALLRLLENFVRQGVVRQFGVASTPELGRYAHAHAPAFAQVLQFAKVLPPPQGMFPPSSASRVFTHSVFRHVPDWRNALQAQPALAQRWSDRLGVDVTRTDALSRIALQAAISEEPKSVVLFSTTNANHLRANVLTSEMPASQESLEFLSELTRIYRPTKVD